jgi:ABC-type Fe3+/spermidine/putrescine transport system ATPase subunit
LVFQDYALFPHLNVLENVKFGLRKLPRRAAEARARDMLALVGLDAFGARKPHELSGGQQQRVALARTLAVAPPLVLLDEPFSNLDAAMRVETRQEVRKLLKAAGSAAILVTHDQEEAMAVADRIAVMEKGRVIQIGTPDEIYRNPVSAFVASFMGRSNILPGTASGMEVKTEFGTLQTGRVYFRASSQRGSRRKMGLQGPCRSDRPAVRDQPPVRSGWRESTGFHSAPRYGRGIRQSRPQSPNKQRPLRSGSSIAARLKSSTIGMTTAFVVP